jgi:predicted dehydrogenase
MRFALLGDHPDGLDMARALVSSHRHELITMAGSGRSLEACRRWAGNVQAVGDIEEILADPAIEAVIVAGPLTVREAQLRRALQSERHVLCVHPVDQTPDAAYEAAMIQKDTGRVLLPLLTEALHPGVVRLAQLAQPEKGPLGTLQLLEIERWGPAETLWTEPGAAEFKATFSGWDTLRALGGEIAEVFAFATGEEAAMDAPFLFGGRFEHGGLFQVTLFPHPNEVRWRLAVIGSNGRGELALPAGWPGPAHLSWRDGSGEVQQESWEDWNPWVKLVDIFEAAVGDQAAQSSNLRRLSWQDAIRSLELDDAARRSVARRRATTLDYQEASEEVGFKGTMTLVGCALLWGMLLLVILSRWFPKLGWVIIPLLVGFLVLQLLRWFVPRTDRGQQKG